MVDKIRKKAKEDDMIPVNTTAIQKPGQLDLANIDNLTIDKLSGVQLPDGEEVTNKPSLIL